MNLLTVEDLIRLGDYDPEPSAAPAPSGAAPKAVRGRALRVWEEDPGPDKSKRDARFFLEMLRDGATPDDAWEALQRLPGGKCAGGRKDEPYRRSTETWAKAQVAEDLLVLRQARRVRASDALLPDSVRLLVRFKDLRPAKWKKLLAKLVSKGVVKKDLEAAIKREESIARADDAGAFVRTAKYEGTVIGWWWKDKVGDWTCYPFHHIMSGLRGRGLVPDVVTNELMGDPWTIVNIPFGPPEPSRREWNKDAARLSAEPAEGPCPTWDQLLRVVGRSLDPYVGAHGFPDGAAYLRTWVASALRRPFVKLPWLFLWGPEDRGKSLFGEALSYLLKKGWADAACAIKEERGFNREIAGAVFCIVEEVALKPAALERLKVWVTGETIQIHEKGGTPYSTLNSMHVVQAGNRITNCPFKAGDTRVTAVEVLAPLESEKMAKDVLQERLRAEVPQALWSFNQVELPKMKGRMGVPTITTAEKASQQEADKTPLEVWCSKHPEPLSDAELVNAFQATLDTGSLREWDAARILREEDPDHRRWRHVGAGIKALLPWGPGSAEQLVAALKLPGLTHEGVSMKLDRWAKVVRGRSGKRGRWLKLEAL